MAIVLGKNCVNEQSSIVPKNLLSPAATVSFADIAHQTLIFDRRHRAEQLVLELIDTRWVQRLRNISQTGNTKYLYMFAEHSRFGHSLGVAYLAILLMRTLGQRSAPLIEPYQEAVAAAALLHDIGHVAPGSHLGEKIWSPDRPKQHEGVSVRVVEEDPEIRAILERYDRALPRMISNILSLDDSVPPWTKSVISGGGWNADRGNWAIVDSAMCCVSYGRYNAAALIDAFRLSAQGELLIQESRIDALTHFFMARDSMYRQIYQHRVLQTADAMVRNIVVRLREILLPGRHIAPPERANTNRKTVREASDKLGIYCDSYMCAAISSNHYGEDLDLETVFHMTESWWQYHIDHWCSCEDSVLSDLSRRLRDRKFLKTIRVEARSETTLQAFLDEAREYASSLGFDSRYYVILIDESDKHRGAKEESPRVLLDSGEVVPATDVEPMIAEIMRRPPDRRIWLAVPKEVKERLGRAR